MACCTSFATTVCGSSVLVHLERCVYKLDFRLVYERLQRFVVRADFLATEKKQNKGFTTVLLI